MYYYEVDPLAPLGCYEEPWASAKMAQEKTKCPEVKFVESQENALKAAMALVDTKALELQNLRLSSC